MAVSNRQRVPYTLANVCVTVTATTVVLVATAAFADADTVSLSYVPPATNPRRLLKVAGILKRGDGSGV
jgi:hypothetical protein